MIGGCVISLDNSWRITVDQRMHISCCACAYQLLCKRTTAVVRPKILTVSITYPISSNNISYLFQQHILALPTTYPSSSNDMKRVYHQLMIHPLFRYSLYSLLIRRKPVEPTGKIIQHLVVIWETMGSISESPSMSCSRIDMHGTLITRLAHS